MGEPGLGHLTEFGIVGLLPEVADDFDVSESVAGYLISGHALSVAIGALGFTAAIARFDRKKVLVGLMTLFIVGNLISALAPTYSLLMVGRVVAAMKYASDAPTMASGADIAAFNVGNALGAGIGGLTLGAGYGFVSPLWVGAALAVAGLGVAVAGARGGSPSGPRAAAPGVAGRAENVGADAFR
nr:MFS transporter [Streptomyces sp. NRRL WC-3618]